MGNSIGNSMAKAAQPPSIETYLHSTQALRTVVAHDADEHAHNLTSWDQRYDQLTPGRFCGVLEEWRASGLQIFRERISHAVRQTCCVWPDAFWLGIERQTGGMRINGRQVGADTIMTRPGNHDFSLMTPDTHEILGIVIDRNTLLAAADRIGCKIAWNKLASAELLHTAPAALQSCKQSIEALLSMQDSRAQTLQQDNVITALLSMLDTSAIDTDICTSLLRRRRIVTDAYDYAMRYQDVPVTVPMLCEHLHVSRRTLQYCFEDVLGISPMAYVRSLRLNGVRRQLQQGTHANMRIGDVAASWGFSNFSQFSCDYKRLFGESPSHVVRNTACDTTR